MSIIYGALERLEANTWTSVIDVDGTQTSPPMAEPKGFDLKWWAVAIAVVMAGTGVMLWPRDGGAGTSPVPSSIITAGQRPVVETSTQQPAQVSVGERGSAPVPPTEAYEGSSEGYEAVPSEPTPAGSNAATVAQRDTASEEASVQQAMEASVSVPSAREEVAGTPTSEAGLEVNGPDPVEAVSSRAQVEVVAADEAIEAARMALSRGDYQRALFSLEKLDPIPEDRSDFWVIKGSAHLGAGQLDSAGAAFATAHALAPHNTQIAVQQAILKQEQGDHAGALQILDQAAARHPDVPEIYLNQGYSQLALGAVRDAKRSFRTFLQITEGRSLYSQQRIAVIEWLAQASTVPQ